MSEKLIRSLAIIQFRHDTVKNWETTNPILLEGEIGVVIGLNEIGDGLEDKTQKVKIGDGIHAWNDLNWWYGPQGAPGNDYVLTDSDKTDIAELVKTGVIGDIETALDGIIVEKVIFKDGETITVENNKEYIADGEISTLTIIYPQTPFICSFNFTLASEGDITIILPESKYIGGIPSFANGETWELNIKNGVVVGGLVE